MNLFSLFFGSNSCSNDTDIPDNNNSKSDYIAAEKREDARTDARNDSREAYEAAERREANTQN